MNVLQIGPLSYVGGVSVHIKRLLLLFKDNSNIRFTMIDESPSGTSNKQYFNIRRLKDFSNCIKLIKQADIVHIHCGHWLIRLYIILLAIFFHKKIIVTLHSFRVENYKSKISLWSLRYADIIISVSNQIAGRITNTKNKSIMKEAFIPPFIEIEEELPIEIQEKINEKRRNKILICANAFRLTSFHNMELYGLDQCIEVAKMAKTHKINILIIFVIGTLGKNDKLFRFFVSKIEREKLENYIYIIPQRISFIALIKECQIVLRPTLSDGDALTIREALYLSKMVIASDVVKRPEGVILYKSGDYNDLFFKIISNINKENVDYLNDHSYYDRDKYLKFYIDLYESCYN